MGGDSTLALIEKPRRLDVWEEVCERGPVVGPEHGELQTDREA
jgi:hypothetical protein